MLDTKGKKSEMGSYDPKTKMSLDLKHTDDV